MSAIVRWLAHSLVLPFLGIGMRIDLFQSCGPCWVFQICCWHNKCRTLMASSFRDSNCPSGISSQNMGSELPPPNMPLWCKDYFELKAVEKKQTQEEFCLPPVCLKKQSLLFPVWRLPVPLSQTSRRTTTVNTGDGTSDLRQVCTDYLNYHYLPLASP